MEGKKTVIGKFGKAIAPNNYYTACHILRKIPKQYPTRPTPICYASWGAPKRPCRTALEIAPNFRLALLILADVLGLKGKYDEKFAIYRRVYADDAELTMALEDGFEKAGYKSAYRALADLMAEWYGKPGKSTVALDIAWNYLDAGDYDLAIPWLEKAYEEHDPNLPYISAPYCVPCVPTRASRICCAK